MPWFCDEIIAQPSSGLLEYLRRQKRLAKGLHLVQDIGLEEHDFPAGIRQLKSLIVLLPTIRHFPGVGPWKWNTPGCLHPLKSFTV